MGTVETMNGFPPAPSGQVTLANWRLPPFNRWAFRNVRQILPTAAIPRNDAAGDAFRRSERAIEAIAFQGPDGREWTVGAMLAATFTDGLLALRRGRLIAERYDSGLLPETPHIVFSVSKSITALLAGILVGVSGRSPLSYRSTRSR